MGPAEIVMCDVQRDRCNVVVELFADAGLEVTDRKPEAVVMGLDRQITHEKLRIAVDAILNGAAFIGTNPDLLLPTAGGFEPGAGATIAAVAAATKVEPFIVGKPEPHMIETALSRLGTVRSATLTIGDQIRLEDLPQLIQQFTVEAKGDSNAQTLAIEKPAFLAPAGHHWVGNWTELRQIVDQLVILKDTHIVADVFKPLLNSTSPTRSTGAFSEREWIMGGLKRNRFHRGKTARSPGLSRKTLYNKIKKLRILE
ncbi:hypothetical protein IVB48_16300 [Bradyrhizobium sp. 76]|nr:hypothetical protein [Bradyrhizobium sp. 76]